MQLVFNSIEGSGEVQLDVLKAICGDTSNKSMIDLGCGFAPITRQLGFKEKLFIDIVRRDLKEESDNFLQKDILDLIDISFPAKEDVSLSLDNIEHFWEDDAKKIIKWMQENSHKQIIFTPQGRYMNVSDQTDTNPDTHKYSWTDKQFQEIGWATITFPNFHPGLGEGGLGAFFAFSCEEIETEFGRVKNDLKSKSWNKKQTA